MNRDTPNEADEQNGPDEQNVQGKTGPDLWTVSAGGFSVTTDAFAVEPPETRGNAHRLWFLSMMGAQTSLKAVWASLLNMPPKPAYLTPGAEGLALNENMYTCQVPTMSIGTWTTRITRMANGMGWHAMIYSRMAEYGFEKEDFLLVTRPGENAAERHHRFLDRRVSLPLHHSWADWLWERGLENGEIEPLECLGIGAWKCVPQPLQLEQDLSHAVAAGTLSIAAEGDDNNDDDNNDDDNNDNNNENTEAANDEPDDG